jgi:FMN phosphatase YigB (HAD superfamily)
MHRDCRLVIFDLDNTLHEREGEDIPLHIRDILQHIRESGRKIALASLNTLAKVYLERYQILHLFDSLEYRKSDKPLFVKKDMFKRIQAKTNIPFSNIVVFDDNYYHCMEAKMLGMKYIRVRNSVLSWQEIKKGLELQSRSQSCFF